MFTKHKGQFLTPQEIERLELETAQTVSRKEAEHKEQFQDEVRAEKLGLGATLNGKRIQHQVRGSVADEHHKKEENTIVAIMALFSVTATAKQLAEEVLKLISTAQTTARASFAASTAATAAVSMNPKDFIFEEESMSVSLATEQAVEMDAAYLDAHFVALQRLGPPGTGGAQGAKMRAQLALQILEEAENLEMRRNPLTGSFVPSIQRVQYYEALHNPNMDERCEQGQVCVFHYRPSAADSRGVKVNVGDQYDQDPQELIASGDHLKGPNAPQFNYS